MPFQFHNADASPYRPGGLLLGHSDSGREVGITLERHALTVAGARRGKGAALIVPNLRRWPHSAVVIDPKGENTFLTWQDRQAMGQRVYVLDPFREADVPDSIRASFNPLAAIDPAAPSAASDLRVIADGLVIRHKAADGEWYDGAADVLAGLMAHVITTAPPERRNLAAVVDMLQFPPDVLANVAADMIDNPACGGMAKAAGVVIAAALAPGAKGTSPEFVNGARRSIAKFGDDAIRSAMSASSFDLAELKTGRATVYVVVPSRYLHDHARFFRLFVRLALNEMEKPLEGKTGLDRLKGTPCLFVLDEFAELGRVDALQKAAGRLAGNGVHLWPFLQNFRQVHDLYGNDGAKTFLANADALTFFGIEQDDDAQRYVSERAGALTPSEIAEAPPPSVPFHEWKRRHGGFFEEEGKARERWQAAEQNARMGHQHAMGLSGRARLTSDAIARMTGRGEGDAVARSMIVFAAAGQVWNLRLAPYFTEQAAPASAAAGDREAYEGQAADRRIAAAANESPLLSYIRRERRRGRDNLIMRAESAPLWQWIAWALWVPAVFVAMFHIGGRTPDTPTTVILWLVFSAIFAVVPCPAVFPLSTPERERIARNRMRDKYGLPPVE